MKKLLILAFLLVLISPVVAFDTGCSKISTDYIFYDDNGINEGGGGIVYDVAISNPITNDFTMLIYNVSWGSSSNGDYPQWGLLNNPTRRIKIYCDGGVFRYNNGSATTASAIACSAGNFYEIEAHINKNSDLINISFDSVLGITNAEVTADIDSIYTQWNNPPATYLNLTDFYIYDGDTCPGLAAAGYNISAEYNTTGISNTQQDYILNINMNEGSIPENVPYVLLNFNGTFYNTTEYNITSIQSKYATKLYLPNVTINETLNFNWSITWFNQTTNITDGNTSNFTMQDFNFILDNCTIGTAAAINFTMLDEETLLPVSATMNSFWSYNFTDLFSNYSTGSSSTHTFCIYPSDVTLTFDLDADYTATGYTTRTYFLDDANLNNTTQQINLYLVNNTNALEFQMSLLDEVGDAIQGGFIQIQRYFRSTGTTITVEIIETDSSGRSLTDLDIEGAEYQTVAIVNGIVVHQGLPFSPYCPQSAVGEPCEREIRLGTESSPLLHNTYTGFDSLLSYNNDTFQFTYSWTDTTGLSHTGRLYVIKQGLTEIVLCDTNSTGASGTVTCTIDATNRTGEVFAYTYNTHSEEGGDQFTTILFDTLNKALGIDAIFWSMLLLFATACIGYGTHSLINTGIIFIMGLWTIKMIGFIAIPYYALMSITSLLIFVVWRLKGS